MGEWIEEHVEERPPRSDAQVTLQTCPFCSGLEMHTSTCVLAAELSTAISTCTDADEPYCSTCWPRSTEPCTCPHDPDLAACCTNGECCCLETGQGTLF